mgnify:CR=1 FL=1
MRAPRVNRRPHRLTPFVLCATFLTAPVSGLAFDTGDTVRILDAVDHPQCAAPGYGMWYAWAIRHLDGDRYGTPTFTEEHRWTMQSGADHWWPKEDT